jgi:hypothetical protein
MHLANFVALMDSEVTPRNTKIHLATWNGKQNPFDVYLAGEFDDWQRWQTKRNFERRFVMALIGLRGVERWLYAGIYESKGCDWIESDNMYYYRLQERASCSEFDGRLVAKFARPGRQSYLNMDKWADQVLVGEILPKRISLGEFPGFKGVDLTKDELDTIVAQGLESWRTALSNVAGVYLISHPPSGRLYVGSATGEGGIWQRWCQYAATGHAGNRELKEMMQNDGDQTGSRFRYSILEIADVHASREDILLRESHWKKILLTRAHGLNAN